MEIDSSTSGGMFNLEVKKTLSCAFDGAGGGQAENHKPQLWFCLENMAFPTLFSMISDQCPVIASDNSLHLPVNARPSTFIQQVLMHACGRISDLAYSLPKKKKKKNQRVQSPLNLLLPFPGIVGHLGLVS